MQLHDAVVNVLMITGRNMKDYRRPLATLISATYLPSWTLIHSASSYLFICTFKGTVTLHHVLRQEREEWQTITKHTSHCTYQVALPVFQGPNLSEITNASWQRHKALERRVGIAGNDRSEIDCTTNDRIWFTYLKFAEQPEMHNATLNTKPLNVATIVQQQSKQARHISWISRFANKINDKTIASTSRKSAADILDYYHYSLGGAHTVPQLGKNPDRKLWSPPPGTPPFRTMSIPKTRLEVSCQVHYSQE